MRNIHWYYRTPDGVKVGPIAEGKLQKLFIYEVLPLSTPVRKKKSYQRTWLPATDEAVFRDLPIGTRDGPIPLPGDGDSVFDPYLEAYERHMTPPKDAKKGFMFYFVLIAQILIILFIILDEINK
ncbi:MAG: hypothetical protein V3T30_01450 [Thermodesulfobacteriota bacterium]